MIWLHTESCLKDQNQWSSLKESKEKNLCLIEDSKIITNGVGKVASLCSEQSKLASQVVCNITLWIWVADEKMWKKDDHLLCLCLCSWFETWINLNWLGQLEFTLGPMTFKPKSIWEIYPWNLCALNEADKCGFWLACRLHWHPSCGVSIHVL